jgi:DMSO/TMAO reductase YedYZ heme-binding membrane subunit
MRLDGWTLTGLLALAVAAMTAAVLGTVGIEEEGVRALIRATARSSFVLFLLAFAARPLRRVWRSDLSGWLLRNRRYLGVSFFVSHLVHLGAILWLNQIAADFQVDPLTLAGGGLAYVLAGAMTATSFDATAAWLGRKRWKQLHTAGMYLLWVIFLQSYAGRVADAPIYLIPTVALLAVFALRMALRFQSRSRTAAA